MDDGARLEFAYRYPFSKAAKEVVAAQPNQISLKYLDMAKTHIEIAVNERIDFLSTKMSTIKLDYVMTYLYARMMLSAMKDRTAIRHYANAEGERSAAAAQSIGKEEVERLCEELGLEVAPKFDASEGKSYEEFAVKFDQYIKNAPSKKGYELVNQRLGAGTVMLDKDRLRGFVGAAAAREIMKGLPIKPNELPQEVLEYCKLNKVFIKSTEAQKKRSATSEAWIEDLLKTPIADVRHRTVNLILAPYLTNVKGLEVEAATKIIVEYIERCKEVEPNTSVNEKYIEYQCSYAKKRGLKPLSRENARELLQGALNI